MALKTTLLLGIVFLCAVICRSEGLTNEQLDEMLNSVRKVCSARFPSLTDDKLDDLRQGSFPEDDQDLKCYTKCVMSMFQVFKKGKYRPQVALKQIDVLLPPKIGERVKATVVKCNEEVLQDGEPCEVAYRIVECTYKKDPELFFFP